MAINSNPIVPTEMEWKEWAESNMTRAWKRMLVRLREEIKEQWAAGTLYHPQDQTGQLAALSRAQVYQQLAEMRYEEFVANYTGESTERELNQAADFIAADNAELVDLPPAGNG